MILTEGELVQWTDGDNHHTGRKMLYGGEPVEVDSHYGSVLVKHS